MLRVQLRRVALVADVEQAEPLAELAALDHPASLEQLVVPVLGMILGVVQVARRVPHALAHPVASVLQHGPQGLVGELQAVRRVQEDRDGCRRGAGRVETPWSGDY